MTHKHNGGPASPLPVGDQECSGRFESGYGGMTLRDYFAAKPQSGNTRGSCLIYYGKAHESPTELDWIDRDKVREEYGDS